MQQLEQEKFGVKVQSHDTIFCLVISVISLQSVLLMEKAGVPGEIYRSFASHWQTYYYFNYIVAVSFSWWWKQEKTTDLSHNVASSSLCLSGIQTHNVR
jgi:hypothetical protein